ncbi:MAG: ribonuclease III [Alphaproteobacteria bacterium]|nr:ribonuclease III [Alphaproteobacteria bacterium]
MSDEASIELLAARLGHEFARRELLVEALTHPSALSPARGRGRRRAPANRSYERLEFLGDRVLGLVVADLLWHRFPDESEGLLTRRLTHLVRRETLARVAAAIDLGPHLVLSRAETLAGAANNPGILADVCEALIAAIYLDGGFAAAFAFVRRQWNDFIEEMTAAPPRDPKTALQEWAQARALALPTYELVGTSGPDHALRFTVAAKVAGRDSATATASSKRIAEARAAELLLERLAAET